MTGQTISEQIRCGRCKREETVPITPSTAEPRSEAVRMLGWKEELGGEYGFVRQYACADCQKVQHCGRTHRWRKPNAQELEARPSLRTFSSMYGSQGYLLCDVCGQTVSYDTSD